MDVEIVVIGESSKWVLNQSYIRIGIDPACEVSLPAGRYSGISGEHVALEAANGGVRLVKGKRSAGETYLNGHPAESGAVVRSGDVLRLGVGGPELRIRLLERDAYTAPAEHEQTRVLYEPAAAAHEPTRVISSPAAHEPTRVISSPAAHEPTRVISSPAATSYSPAPPPAAGAGARQGYTQAAYGSSAGAYAPPAPAPQRSEIPPPVAVQSANDGQSLRMLEGKLKSMRLLLAANLALVAILLVWNFMQGQELAQTHKDLQALRAQAQTAMSTLTPSLDAKLNVFEKRMDEMDAKVAVAQDRMVKGMDAEAKLAEDRMVQRMNTEIPAMMDKYVAKKMTEIKH